jgi:hypothetical protein
MALFACDGDVATPAPLEPPRCDEQIAQKTAIYCTGFKYCSAATFSANYYDAEDCAISVLSAMRKTMVMAEKPAVCEAAVLDYYDCFNAYGCDIFGTEQERAEKGTLYACLAEGVGVTYSCEEAL